MAGYVASKRRGCRDCPLLLRVLGKANKVSTTGRVNVKSVKRPSIETLIPRIASRGFTAVLMRLPSSRATLRVRLSPVDVALAAAAPFAALYLRNAELVSDGGWIFAGRSSLGALV